MAFEQAWQSWCRGSLAVGAAVTCNGEIVARGQNQIHHDGPGPLSRTHLAHAEMNALAQVPTERGPDYRVVTTFEPCMLCAVACRFYRVSHVAYASADPVCAGRAEWLATAMPSPLSTTTYECLGGPVGLFGYVLHVSRLVAWAPEHVLTPHREATPAPFELATSAELTERLRARAVARDGEAEGVGDAYEAVSELLVEACGG